MAQTSTVNLTLHARVDTSKQEIREIVELWRNYLSSKPDSIYNNPYWNEAEKMKFDDFDFTRSSIYQIPSAQLLNYYTPTVLSVEKEGKYFAIRTLFYAEGLDGIYKKSNPWCITKLYATKENYSWKIQNAISIVTETWNRTTIGKITFVYPPEHNFNQKLAEKANKFCDSIALKFQLPDWKPFDMYITRNADELGKLLGFEFFFAGYSTGRSMNEERVLLGGTDSEYYPHEFIHMIDGTKQIHGIVEEGFATWASDQLSSETTFNTGTKALAKALAKNDTVKLNDIVNKKWGLQNASLYYYSTGGIICKLIYNKGGVQALKKLLITPPDNDKLIQIICELLKIKTVDLDELLRAEILKYH